MAAFKLRNSSERGRWGGGGEVGGGISGCKRMSKRVKMKAKILGGECGGCKARDQIVRARQWLDWTSIIL
jgi:hypothetical protein